MADGSPPWNGSASVGAGPAPEEQAQYARPPRQYADVGRETLSQLVLPSQSVALWEVLYHWHHGP